MEKKYDVIGMSLSCVDILNRIPAKMCIRDSSSVLMILPSSFTNVLDLALGAAVFAAGFLLALWMDNVKFKQAPEEK